MNILKLQMSEPWFTMVKDGHKLEEYREIKQFYISRLCYKQENGFSSDFNFKEFNKVEFINGYRKDSKRFTKDIKSISIGIGKPEWGAPDHKVFIIKINEKV